MGSCPWGGRRVGHDLATKQQRIYMSYSVPTGSVQARHVHEDVQPPLSHLPA